MLISTDFKSLEGQDIVNHILLRAHLANAIRIHVDVLTIRQENTF